MEPPTREVRGVKTIVNTVSPNQWPLNSVQLHPGMAKRIARRVPGYRLVATAINRRRFRWNRP
jgi:hypothetical protein